MPGPFEAVVFDMDGTLVTPTVDFKQLRLRLGVPENESILDWIRSQPPQEREDPHRILTDVEHEAAGRTELMPGARQTLDWLCERGVRFGVLTRNSRAVWGIVSARCGLEAVLHVVTRDDGLAKPDPSCLSPFLEIWKTDPRRIVHVGDYRYDLELARATGMYSILLQESGQNPFPVPCDYVAKSHRSLLEHLSQLPFLGPTGAESSRKRPSDRAPSE